MIALKELFTLLSTGEFSNIGLSRNETNSIHESEYPKVLGHINLGLVEIYKRFLLMENELLLHVTPEVSTYYLREDRVVPLSAISSQRYIEQPEDFEGCLNFVRFTKVFDASGTELTLNNRFSQPPNIAQVSSDVLKITGLTAPQVLSVMYQAYPTKLVVDEFFDLDSIMLPIPETILDALLNFIAYRVYKPSGANNSTANADKSSAYHQQYELACQKIELYGLAIPINDKAEKFDREGWV